ncbi:MAG: hypothetical protein IPN34_11360 [Planctomycetes bacterium]|nr:hypothetical protein [Planctomycetota bacterium]
MTLSLGALALSCFALEARSQSAADFVPQGAIFSLHVPNLGQAIDGVRNAAETVCAHPVLNKALQDGLQEMSREIGFNPLQKNTWKTLGIDVARDAALYVTMQQAGESLEPFFGFVMPVTDAKVLQDFIGRMAARDRKMEWRAVEGIEGAVQPWIQAWDGEGMNAEDMVLLVRNGYAVLCGSDDDDKVLESAKIAAAMGKGLASDAVYGEALQSLGARQGYASLRIKTLLESLRQVNAAKAAEWRKKAEEAGDDGAWMKDVADSMEREGAQMNMVSDLLKGFGDNFVMGASADETGVRLGTWMKGPSVAEAMKPRATHPALNSLIQPNAMAVLRYAMNPNMLEQMFLGLPAELKEEMDLEEAEAGLEMVNGMLGIDLVQDVWRQWSGRLQISMAAPEEAFQQGIVDAILEGDMNEQAAMELASMADFTIALEFVDAKGAATAVETGISLLGESAPVLVEAKEIANGKVWSIGPDMGGDPKPIGAVAIVHNTLVAGTMRGVEGALARVGSQAAPQLAEANVAKSLAEPSATAAYLDLKPIHKLVKTLSETIQEEELSIAEGVLMALDSLAFWQGAKGDVARGEAVIRFR